MIFDLCFLGALALAVGVLELLAWLTEHSRDHWDHSGGEVDRDFHRFSEWGRNNRGF